jgi:hypothetical protein
MTVPAITRAPEFAGNFNPFSPQRWPEKSRGVIADIREKKYNKAFINALKHRVQAVMSLYLGWYGFWIFSMPSAAYSSYIQLKLTPLRECVHSFLYLQSLNLTYFFAAEILVKGLDARKKDYSRENLQTGDATERYGKLGAYLMHEYKKKLVDKNKDLIKKYDALDEEDALRESADYVKIKKLEEDLEFCTIQDLIRLQLFDFIKEEKPELFLNPDNISEITSVNSIITQQKELSPDEKNQLREIIEKGSYESKNYSAEINALKKLYDEIASPSGYLVTKTIAQYQDAYTFDKEWRTKCMTENTALPSTLSLSFLKKRVQLINKQSLAFSQKKIARGISLFLLNRIISVAALIFALFDIPTKLFILSAHSVVGSVEKKQLAQGKLHRAFCDFLVNIPAVVAPEIGLPIYLTGISG